MTKNEIGLARYSRATFMLFVLLVLVGIATLGITMAILVGQNKQFNENALEAIKQNASIILAVDRNAAVVACRQDRLARTILAVQKAIAAQQGLEVTIPKIPRLGVNCRKVGLILRRLPSSEQIVKPQPRGSPTRRPSPTGGITLPPPPTTPPVLPPPPPPTPPPFVCRQLPGLCPSPEPSPGSGGAQASIWGAGILLLPMLCLGALLRRRRPHA